VAATMVAINALEVEYIKKLRIGRNFARALPCPDPIPGRRQNPALLRSFYVRILVTRFP